MDHVRKLAKSVQCVTADSNRREGIQFKSDFLFHSFYLLNFVLHTGLNFRHVAELRPITVAECLSLCAQGLRFNPFVSSPLLQSGGTIDWQK